MVVPFKNLGTTETATARKVRIRSNSGPYFLAFGLNTEIYGLYEHFLRSVHLFVIKEIYTVSLVGFSEQLYWFITEAYLGKSIQEWMK